MQGDVRNGHGISWGVDNEGGGEGGREGGRVLRVLVSKSVIVCT